MCVFYLLLLIPLAIQHFTIKRHSIDYQKKNRHALFFFFALMTILVALRHKTIGTDTQNYIYYFNRFSKTDWTDIQKESLELGFALFNKAISLISSNPQFFLAVVTVVIVIMMYPTYRRLCVDASLTIVLFCTMSTFVMMFSGIRQMLAVGLGFIAYEFTRRKKLIWFILVVFLALSFHASAFMLAFMYPLYHVKITKKWLFAVIPALGAVFLFNTQIFSVLSLIIERYTEYEGKITQTGAYTMIILFALFVVFAFLIPDEARLDKETIGLRNLLLLALVLQMFSPLHTIAMRMNYYYIVFIPLLLPKIIACRSERWGQVAVLSRHIMVIFFLFYFFINAYSGTNLKVFPYHFFWENIA